MKQITSFGMFILILLSFNNVKGQKILISGEAECLIVDVNLMKKYEFDVLQYAINNALYNSFGSSITSNYERVTETFMEGRSVLSHTEMRSQYIHSFPNGIWREHKKEPEYLTYKDEKGNWWLKCTVVGYAEAMMTTPAEFEAKILDGFDIIKDESISFISGESGYLYFRSAASGFLVVFYDDYKNVQRCLPYNAIKDKFIEIEANKNYIFFSPDHADSSIEPSKVDEIEFYTESQLEYNQFYILFSPTEITLPLLNDEAETINNYFTFKSLDREKFHHWLQNIRLKNKDLQVEIIGVTIKKSQNSLN